MKRRRWTSQITEIGVNNAEFLPTDEGDSTGVSLLSEGVLYTRTGINEHKHYYHGPRNESTYAIALTSSYRVTTSHMESVRVIYTATSSHPGTNLLYLVRAYHASICAVLLSRLRRSPSL